MCNENTPATQLKDTTIQLNYARQCIEMMWEKWKRDEEERQKQQTTSIFDVNPNSTFCAASLLLLLLLQLSSVKLYSPFMWLRKKICFRKMCAIQLSVRFVLFLRTYTPSRLGSTLCVDSTVSAFYVSNPRGESIQWERQLMHNKSSTSYLLPAAHFTDSIFTQPQPSMQAIERIARSSLDSFAKVWCITSLFLLAFCVYAWHFSSYTVSMCSQLWCYTITTGYFTPIREKKDDRTRKMICTYKRIMLSSHSLVRLLRIFAMWDGEQQHGLKE